VTGGSDRWKGHGWKNQYSEKPIMENPASGKTIDGVSRLMEKPLVVDPTAG